MNERAEQNKSIDNSLVISPWPNNTRNGCYWLPYVNDTVEIKATVDFLGLL